MKDFDKTNEEMARKLAINATRSVDDNGQDVYNAFCEAALQEMAKWKDEQWESNLREFLYRTFYVHPHDCNHICTDDFECKGDFDQFVDDFINRLKDPEQWPYL